MWPQIIEALIWGRQGQEGFDVLDETCDPKGLIRESYRIDGITVSECRSIFLDWAISLPEGLAPEVALRELLAVHGGQDGHPMTQVLREGLLVEATPARRGGRSARLSSRDPSTGENR